jgi:hypothetical protein
MIFILALNLRQTMIFTLLVKQQICRQLLMIKQHVMSFFPSNPTANQSHCRKHKQTNPPKE